MGVLQKKALCPTRVADSSAPGGLLDLLVGQVDTGGFEKASERGGSNQREVHQTRVVPGVVKYAFFFDANRASLTSSGTRTPRMGPVGAESPRASRSLFRNGRSHAKSLSATRQVFALVANGALDASHRPHHVWPLSPEAWLCPYPSRRLKRPWGAC